MPLQQWHLYESMSVLKDSTTKTTICNVPETGQRAFDDPKEVPPGYRRSATAAAVTTAVVAFNDFQAGPSDGGNAMSPPLPPPPPQRPNGANWSMAEDAQQRYATRKRPASAANDALNAFPSQASVERRTTKKTNVVKENDGAADKRRVDDDVDESLQFLLSLLPYLREIPKHRKLTVRHKLQKVFIDEQEKWCGLNPAAFTGHQRAVVTAAPVPIAMRGPPPPYPGKSDFSFAIQPAQNASAANAFTIITTTTTTTTTTATTTTATTTCTNTINATNNTTYCGALVCNVDNPPARRKPNAYDCGMSNNYNKNALHAATCTANKSVNDIPLLNVDYTASLTPTIYYNSKVFGTGIVSVSSADYSAAQSTESRYIINNNNNDNNNNNNNNDFVTPVAVQTRAGTTLNIGTAVADVASDFSAVHNKTDSYNNNNNNNNTTTTTVIVATNAAGEMDDDSWTYCTI